MFMAKFLVEYTHVEETTYQDWIEADSEAEAIEKAENGEVDFENYCDGCGIEFKDVEVIDQEG